ncbi:MAG: TonB-dependent receptor [Acidobacteria bacterium]|nr:TonB-dependent receptor [Acidobacteriota bacterium]
MRRLALTLFLWWPSVIAAQPNAQPPDASTPPAATQPTAVTAEDRVDVVAVTPLHGSGLPRLFIPANVQVITLPQGGGAFTDLAAVLTRGLATPVASEVQGGTFQPDVIFRGFGGSPLLGASEGLAVYVDGMRANEPFGDVVNWDGLPTGAIDSINVMAGSNPLFGLNALGGAVSVRTRNGFDARGSRVSVAAGSWDRLRADGETGVRRGRTAGFVAGSWLEENGWRDFSPSTLRRAFGKGSWRGDTSAVDAAVTVASNDLLGNGTAPEQLLAERRSAVFTHPDRTDNDLASFTLRADRFATSTLRVETMAYVRRARIGTLNGDAGEDDDHDDDDDDDHAIHADHDDDDDDEVELDGALNRSRTRNVSGGAAAQVVWTQPWQGRANQLIAGVTFDAASSTFGFSSEFGYLSSTREAIGAGLMDDDAAVDLKATTRTASILLTDTLDVTPRLHVTASARANWTTVRLRDRIGVALNGDHRFARLTPSVGVTFDASPSLNLYASWAQSSRVPTPVELTCADPEDPCRLPNAFVSDPPLDQPVAGTWEAGARGSVRRASWNLSIFDSRVTNDLIFVSSGRVRGSGHFENVERTRRRGVEATGEWRVRDVTVSGSYTLQRATYGADLTVLSPVHPDADDGQLDVESGARLPGVPAHVGRVGVSARLASALDVAATWRVQSSQFLRGDEANLLAPVSGFSAVDAQARWKLGARVTLVGQVINMFDTDYATFGMLGEADVLEDAYEGRPRFLSPGAPRAAWFGVEVGF